MMMKILGVVTSYYPKFDELERNILSYLSSLDHLIIWENTLKEDSQISQLVARIGNSKIEIRTTGQNEYLAFPINTCIKWAEENGYSHILTMDQDSFFPEGDFTRFIEIIKNNMDNNIAIFTPVMNFDRKLSGTIVEVENAITSGSIYPIDIFNKVGAFREDFLIYMIDIEFGIRVRKKGFKITCLPEVVLIHHIGYAKKSRMGLLINYYSAQSTYYIIRNIMLTWKLYPDQFSIRDRFNFFKYKIVFRTIKIVFEPDKLLKLKAIYLGFFHGLVNKSGRCKI
jgi:rhamnosyltransferase